MSRSLKVLFIALALSGCQSVSRNPQFIGPDASESEAGSLSLHNQPLAGTGGGANAPQLQDSSVEDAFMPDQDAGVDGSFVEPTDSGVDAEIEVDSGTDSGVDAYAEICEPCSGADECPNEWVCQQDRCFPPAQFASDCEEISPDLMFSPIFNFCYPDDCSAW